MAVEIRAVQNRRELKKFVKFPWRIYRGDEFWVPPLITERCDFLNQEKNSFFRHSEARLFLAYQNSSPVGRISAHTNVKHNETHGENTGFFGFFECIDDAATAQSLFDAAEGWLRLKGCSSITGPASFTINDEYGLLIDGFDSLPVVMMSYNPPYYQHLIEESAFEKVHDLWAYELFSDSAPPDSVFEKAKAAEASGEYIFRGPDMKNFKDEALAVRGIFNAAWSENWGAVPMTEGEFLALAKELKMILDPDFLIIAEKDGKPVGFSLAIPNVNEALRHANGRLFPVGLLKFLWHKRHIKMLRVLAMGVEKEHRKKGVDAVFYIRTYERAIRKGYERGELSWILESNKPMNRVLQKLGARVYKTYRVYRRTL